MKVQVEIYPSINGQFIASYIDPLTSNRVREMFSSRSECNNYKKQVNQNFNEVRLETLRDKTINELLIYYNSSKQNNQLFKSKNIHLTDFSKTFGGMKISDFNSEHARWWFDMVQKENNLKDISMRGIKCKLDGFFKFLLDESIITDSPISGILYKKLAPKVNTRNIISKAALSELLEDIKLHSLGLLYPMVLLVSETGCKTNELIDLNWKQIDLSFNTGKFSKGARIQERTLELSDELISLLKLYKHRTGTVFRNHYKEPFTRNKLTRLINEYKAKSKLDIEWNLIDLRHTLAINMKSEGKSDKEIQYVMGHKDLYDTKRLYTQ